jgi:hypothetical protein
MICFVQMLIWSSVVVPPLLPILTPPLAQYLSSDFSDKCARPSLLLLGLFAWLQLQAPVTTTLAKKVILLLPHGSQPPIDVVPKSRGVAIILRLYQPIDQLL